MSTQTVSKKDIAASVVPPIKITAPWRVKAVETLDGYRLRVRPIDGLEDEVHMSEFVHAADAGVFAALADPDVFRQVYVELGRSRGRVKSIWRRMRCMTKLKKRDLDTEIKSVSGPPGKNLLTFSLFYSGRLLGVGQRELSWELP